MTIEKHKVKVYDIKLTSEFMGISVFQGRAYTGNWFNRLYQKVFKKQKYIMFESHKPTCYNNIQKT